MPYIASSPFSAAFETLERAGLPHAKLGEVFTADDALELAKKITAKYGLYFSLRLDDGQWQADLRCPATYSGIRNESAIAAIVLVAASAAQFYSSKAA